MAGWMTQFLNLWVIRIVILSSFAAHLVLILFAEIRRRKAFGRRTILLWLAYQVGSWAATSALGNLTLGRTLREQQLVTFWVPFLLLHLGGPDNISAYSLEDNVLSARQMLNVAAQVVGATYGLYRHIIIGSDGGLLWASVILFFFGVGKYVEKALALWRGDFGSIRSSMPSSRLSNPELNEEAKQQQHSELNEEDKQQQHLLKERVELSNEGVLLVAHDLFRISKGAFVDYSVKDQLKEGDIYINRERFSSFEWKDMCKVVEMELSLMYDILYTKAAMVHTWHGYGIRVASPLATGAAFWLFWLYHKDGQRRGDVVITYILLVSTFLLDLGWLLTALGSTWTYAFLNDRPRCRGRWLWFRRFIISLDPCRLLAKEPTSYRLWSGSIGQYNLLHECTHDATSQWRALATKVGLEDRWMEYQYHYSRGLDILQDHVRDDLFEQIWKYLKSAYPPEKQEEATRPHRRVKREEPKKEVILRMHRELEEALNFDPEFQEDILIWHIATDVFLLSSDQNAASPTYAKAIKALSDYMVFLVVVRPNMVPGLKLRSTYEATRDALEEIWHEKGSSSSSKISPICTAREKELASILRNMENERGRKKRSILYDRNIILSDGTMLAEELLDIADSDWEETKCLLPEEIKRFLPDLDAISGTIDMQELLELIFKAWVRMLMFVSVRCSRDSHAKQLGRGGELTTIVWILAEHAGTLRIPAQ